MAGKGPVPKPRRSRTRDEKPLRALERAQGAAPGIPDGEWLPQTLSWWDTWRSSPQGEHFSETSWQRLRMLVPLIDAFWKAPTKELLAEIRQNESLLGATPADLARLHWKIEPPKAVVASVGRYDHIEPEVG